jgi:cytochrome P450
MIAYPDLQREIQKELDEVVGIGNAPSTKHRGDLPLTEACLNEVMRHSAATLMPAVMYGTGRAGYLRGHFIPENTLLFINYFSLTRDQRFWENPEEFNPYRFLTKSRTLRKDLLDKFYPFGMGDRRCVGEYIGRLQNFVLFTRLLQKCKFENVPGQKISFEHNQAPSIGPKRYKIIVKKRVQKNN